MAVLIITERYDPTADLLIGELRRRDQPYVRWNLDDFPLSSSLSYRIAEDGIGGTIVSEGRILDLDDISGVWCRSFRPGGFLPELTGEERRFAQVEAEIALSALPAMTKCRWINDPIREHVASSKAQQLVVARQLGLAIPRTVISNDADEIHAFRQSCTREVIYKASGHPMDLEPGKAVFTGVLTERMLPDLDLIKQTPGIFQERIPKDYEIRATVVDETVFSVKIRSQDMEQAKVDWRQASTELDYEAIDLPGEIEGKILEFMSAFGLVYSSMDFIVAPDKAHVFLESNPGGQFAWAEAAAGVPITAALADALT